MGLGGVYGSLGHPSPMTLQSSLFHQGVITSDLVPTSNNPWKSLAELINSRLFTSDLLRTFGNHLSTKVC